MTEKKLRILWHSVAPFVRSGYGKGTKYITSLLKKYGYDPIISAYYGVEPGGVLDYLGIPILSSKEGPFGVVSAAKFARQYQADIGILFCYDDKTEVLTNQGWKLFRDLNGSELVVQYNPKEKYLEYVKPLKYFVLPYEGDMYYVESRDLSLCVTPNHRLYVKKRDSTRKNDYSIEFPDQLLGKRRKYLKIATWKNKEEMNIYKRKLSKILNKYGWLESNCCTRSLSTKDRNLADKYQIIAIRAGFSSDIHKDRNQFIVSIKKRKDTEIRPKTDIGRDGFRKYKGFIYSLRVPSGLVLTRREHKIVISGNTDFWAFSEFARMLPNATLYGPMDMLNYPEEILNFTRMYYKIISLCKWQQENLKKVGIESDCIYHGVDLNIFKPMDKDQCKQAFGIPKDKFVFGTVAANSDKENRKSHAQMMKAMRYFLDSNPDVKESDILWLYHSVSSRTPILVQEENTGLIDIVPICSLFTRWTKGYEYKKLDGVKVWDGNKFSKINEVSRHPINIPYKRIVTSNGLIEVTDSHSIFYENGTPALVAKLKKSDKICLKEFPIINNKCEVTKELAWLLGIFSAEGTLDNDSVIICNNNINLLKHCKELVLKSLSKYSSIEIDKEGQGRLNINSRTLSKLFREWCYIYESGYRKVKKVPRIILNSNFELMQSFFDGYYAGDGTTFPGQGHMAFTCTSLTLTQGLLYILNKLGYTWNLNYDLSKECARVYIRSKKSGPRRDLLIPNVIKEIQIVRLEERDSKGRILTHRDTYMYDVSTENETFLAGAGNILAHNSVPNDPRGMPLSSICHKFRLDNVIKFMDPNIADTMISEEQLAALMNCFDVHLLASKREGFGMPILETMAVGVPNICHSFSSMKELVEDNGWLCKSLGYDLNLETTPINAETASPDVYSLADCIKDAYFDDKKREGYGRKSREFALKYSWDDLVRYQWVPLLEHIQEESKSKSLGERKII